MSDIAKKPRRLTPLDRRNYGVTNPHKKPNKHYPVAPELPPNPTMKRVRGVWKCIECGMTFSKPTCGYCDGQRNRMKV